MADIVWSDVVLHAPGLSTLSGGLQQDILAHVNSALRVDDFGGESAQRYKLARIYLAAHMGQLQQNASSGVVNAAGIASESVGGISRSYSTGSAGATSPHGQTVWGQLFDDLVNTSAARAPIVL